MRSSMRYIVFLLIFTLTTLNVEAVWGAEKTNSDIHFSFSLPKAVTEVDFQNEKTVGIVKKNGIEKDYQMVGTAFLFKNTTYVPVRDIANVFGTDINYHEKDKIVELNGFGKKVIISVAGISPSSYGYDSNEPGTSGTLVYENDGASRLYEGVVYFNVNDRAYLPLRSVLEIFDFQVNYDHERKLITICGETLHANKNIEVFDEQQQRIIRAFAELDEAASIKYRGNWSENAAWPVEAVQQINVYPERKEIRYDVVRLADKAHFEACLTQSHLNDNGKYYYIPTGGVLKNLFQKNVADGSLNWINLIGGTGGAGTYFDIGNLELMQLGKYQPMIYEIVNENEEFIEYRITKLADKEKDIQFKLDKTTNKVVSYAVTIEGEKIELEIYC